MSFNHDPKNKAVEAFFYRKQNPSALPKLTFNKAFVFSEESTKLLGLILHKRLFFNHHLKEKNPFQGRGLALLHVCENIFLARNYYAFTKPL